MLATSRFTIARPASLARRALFLAMLIAVFIGSSSRAQQPTDLDAAVALEQKLVNAIAAAENSVVAIARVRRNDVQNGLPESFPGTPPSPTDPAFVPNEYGTGVIIDASGLILTAYHVLGDPEENDYYIWTNRVPYKAVKVEKAMAGDPWMDLAVLKIDAENLPPIRFGDAKDLKKGHIVVALGNPLAIARDGEVSASWGIVSNLFRKAAAREAVADTDSAPETLHQYGTLIQTDARLNFGVSGGALINLNGEMVGMLTSLSAGPGYDSAAGFAIPVDENFKRTVGTLSAGRRVDYGFLGVLPRSLTREERQRGLRGARIRSVVATTPAARARLQPDDIVTAVNRFPVFDESDLIRQVSALPPEHSVELTIDRNGQVLNQRVTLAKKAMTGSHVPFFTVPEPQWRGLQVDYATSLPLFYQQAQAIDPDVSLGVKEVAPDSPAWVAGFRAGDYIVRVGRKTVSTPRDFFELVSKNSGAVNIEVFTGNRRAVRTVAEPEQP